MVTVAEKEQLTYQGFLAELLLAECDDRTRRRSIRRVKAAGFPRDRWLADFDFDANPNINPATIHTLAGCGWIRSGQPLCLIGDSGTGKSHLLIGLGTAAAETGFRVKYTLATKLVNELVEAADDKILAKTIAGFEVIAGKAMPATGRSSCFGYVQTYDSKPQRRLFEVLASHGMQPNQQVTFLTAGGEDIRDLPRYLNPQAEHLLDSFHITMRITVLTQLAKGLRCQSGRSANIAQELQRVKWFLWHGNVFRARQTVDDLTTDLTDTDTVVESGKLAKAVREFGGYLAANAAVIPN